MKLKYRRAEIADVQSVYRLVLQGTRRGKILKRPVADIRKSIHHFWVAQDAGRTIACCALEIYNKKLAEIRSLVVEPSREKQGIATRLLEICLKEAKKRKVYEVLAITDRDGIFRRHGFSEQLHGQKALFLRP